MSNHPDVLDETLERIEYELRVKLNSDGVFNPQYNNLLLQIEEAKQQIKSHFRSVEEIEAAMPKKAEVGFEFFIEDKSQGWTKEQLQERVWGYNQALDDFRKALGLEG